MEDQDSDELHREVVITLTWRRVVAIASYKPGERDRPGGGWKGTCGDLTSAYSGGRIHQGHLIRIVDERGGIDLRYHPINDRNELMTGICRSTPETLPNGKIRLHGS